MREFLIKHKLILEYVCKCFEIAALAIAIVTLHTDIETRNSEYKPRIKVEVVQEEKGITFCWNINKESKDVEFEPVLLKLSNIGNGNADNVTVEFDTVVLEKWMKELKELNPKGDYKYLSSYSEGEMKKTFSYMLKNAESSYTVKIPEIYFDYLNEIYKQINISEKQEIELSTIKMKIKCYDIQDKPLEYQYEINYMPEQKIFDMDSNFGEQKTSYKFKINEDNQSEMDIADILNIFFWALFIVVITAALIGSVIYVIQELKNKTEKLKFICNVNVKEKSSKLTEHPEI